MTTPIKFVIAEDHELTRSGLVFSLEKKAPHIKVVGEAERGDQVVELVEKERPNVVLMDLEMPVMDGIEATHLIKQRFPQTRVMMLTSHEEGEEVYAALAAGADAYCKKDIKAERLVQVIEMVNDGTVWLDPAIARLVMQALPLNLPERMKSPQNRQKYNVELTDREIEVLEQIVAGKSNREIADQLCITVHTVKAHVANIIQKLAVDDRTQAAVKALRDGLVTSPRQPS